MGPAFAESESRSVILGLWMVAFGAHATATGNIVLLTHSDLCWVCCRRRHEAAAKVLSRVCAQVGYRVWFHPRTEPVPSWYQLRTDLVRSPYQPGTEPVPVPYDFGAVSVHVRNLLKKQITNSATRGDAPRDSRPSDTPNPNSDTPNTEEEEERSPSKTQDFGAEPPKDPLGDDRRLLNLLAKNGRDPSHRSEILLASERELWLLDHIGAIRSQAEETSKSIRSVAMAWWSRYLAARRANGDYGATPLREYYRRASDLEAAGDRELERKLIKNLDRETEAEGIGLRFDGVDP